MRVEQKLILPLILTAVGNLITAIIKNVGLMEYLIYVGTFILIIPILFIVKTSFKDKTISYFLLSLSLISISINDLSFLNDIFFLAYSVILFRHKKTVYIIYCAIYFSVLTGRYSFGGFEPSEIMVHLSGVSFISVIFQHYIFPKVNNKNNSQELRKLYKPLEVKNTVVDIIQLRGQGFDWWEINDKLELNIKDSELPRKVREERKRLKFKNQDEFNFWLFKNGIIQPISNESNIRT